MSFAVQSRMFRLWPALFIHCVKVACAVVLPAAMFYERAVG